MKRAVLLFAFFIAGALAGGLGIYVAYARNFSATLTRASGLLTDAYRSALYNHEVEEADKQLANPNRDVAIYALERATRQLKSLQPPRMLTCRSTALHLAKYQIRLYELYGVTGDTAAQQNSLAGALAAYRDIGWRLSSTDELKHAMPLIKDNKTPVAMEKFGAIVPPCDWKSGD